MIEGKVMRWTKLTGPAAIQPLLSEGGIELPSSPPGISLGYVKGMASQSDRIIADLIGGKAPMPFTAVIPRSAR
jgi:hypothetical protein